MTGDPLDRVLVKARELSDLPARSERAGSASRSEFGYSRCGQAQSGKRACRVTTPDALWV